MKLRKPILLIAATILTAVSYAQSNEEQDSIQQPDTDTLPDDAIVIHRVPLASGPELDLENIVVDTIPSSSEGLNIVLYNDNTWRYIRNRDISALDETVFSKKWNNDVLNPYNVDTKDLPISIIIDLVDSLKSYHYPYKGRVSSKYGYRRRRAHQGTDLGLKVGEPIYATFDGRVRVTQHSNKGYGNLVIIRHDNGLETYYAHLSEILVEANQWVTAGQVIGKGGSTGRSTGPHLHFEMRYQGLSFDAERLIDFETGMLRRETFLLKRTYFNASSRFEQDFEVEIQSDEEDKKIAAEAAARKYHTVRSGDTLGRIAINNGTTVKKLCQLNGIKETSILSLGQKIRVR